MKLQNIKLIFRSEISFIIVVVFIDYFKIFIIQNFLLFQIFFIAITIPILNIVFFKTKIIIVINKINNRFFFNRLYLLYLKFLKSVYLFLLYI